MNERLFFVAVIKSEGQTGISILNYDDNEVLSATGLYFDRDLPFKSATQAYGDFILERLKPGELAVIVSSYEASKSKHRYPFTFVYQPDNQPYQDAKGFARLTLMSKQNIQRVNETRLD